MKVMAIDFGDARTGVAFSDISGIIAGETLVVKTRSLEKPRRSWPTLQKTGAQARSSSVCPKTWTALKA